MQIKRHGVTPFAEVSQIYIYAKVMIFEEKAMTLRRILG